MRTFSFTSCSAIERAIDAAAGLGGESVGVSVISGPSEDEAIAEEVVVSIGEAGRDDGVREGDISRVGEGEVDNRVRDGGRDDEGVRDEERKGNDEVGEMEEDDGVDEMKKDNEVG